MSVSDDQVHVSVERTTGGEVVLRKRATGPESGRRLTREGAVLDAARHPGTVQVVRRSGAGETTELDLAWAGPHSLASQPRLPISEVAGLATSLATTVADLHDLGIVHGRILPEHVLVGVNGRPVLCGFSDAVMPGLGGGCDAAPGDDVAAIGSLISWLAGTESDVEPIPEHRWWRGRRWDGYHRRALLNLADHACGAAPDHRPSARALADAITNAVPSARLPIDRSPLAAEPPAVTAVGREATRLGAPAGAPGPLGRARVPETVTPRVLHEPTPAERPQGTAEQRTPWPSAPNERGSQPATSRGPAASTDLGERDAAEAAQMRLPVVGRTSATNTPSAPSVSRPEPTRSRGPRSRLDEAAGSPAAEPLVDRGRASRIARRIGGVVGRGGRSGDSGATTEIPLAGAASSIRSVGADDSVEAERAPASSRPTPGRRRVALGGVAAGLVLVSALVLGVLADGRGGGAASELPAPTPTTGAGPRRPSGDSPCPTVVGPRADADGDGCAELVVADGRRVRVGDRSFLVGDTGDRVAIGDWDCDGSATPAVLRVGTGAIYTFAGWPERGALPPATLVASVERATAIHERTGPSPGCPVLVVDRRDQPARVLDLGAGR